MPAWGLYDANQVDEARHLYGVIAEDPDTTDLIRGYSLCGLALCFIKQGDPRGAVRHAVDAVRIADQIGLVDLLNVTCAP